MQFAFSLSPSNFEQKRKHKNNNKNIYNNKISINKDLFINSGKFPLDGFMDGIGKLSIANKTVQPN